MSPLTSKCAHYFAILFRKHQKSCTLKLTHFLLQSTNLLLNLIKASVYKLYKPLILHGNTLEIDSNSPLEDSCKNDLQDQPLSAILNLRRPSLP